VSLLVTTDERPMADETHAQPLNGTRQTRLKLGGLRALRGGRETGHDFNDSRLHGRMKRECRRIYTRAFGAISDNDWDAAFNFAYGQAWKVEREKGSIDSLTAWLTTAAHNAVVSEHRKTGRVDLLATEEFLVQPDVTDLADTVDDRQILRDAIFCLKTVLPERARLVWTMRFAGDYEPGEIQRQLNISKKAYEKDLEVASRLVVDRLESARKSGVCDTPDMTSMVRAYAIWGEEHGAERASLAREHLDQCPACRRTVRVLRSAQRAAAFLPPPILGLPSQHSPPLGVVLHATESVAARIQDGLWRLTDRIQDGLLRMKYGLTKLVSRGPASGPVGADRTATVLGAGGTSGAAIATKAVVGCLAAGVLAGGTGACLKAAGVGVPGLTGLIHSITGSPHRRVHESRSPHYASIPAQSLSVMPSSTAMQGALVRPVRPSGPTSAHLRVLRKATRHAPSTAMVARSEFGSPRSSTPQASPAEVSAARNDFSSTPSHIARTASSTGNTPAEAARPSEPHTNKASTKAAEGEFEGP
jgi:DNA-directed RNA polymerase specialized sigma24 family protein